MNHDEVITEIIEAFRERGFRIYRLDKRHYPDAVFIKNGKICALEVESHSSLSDSKKINLEKTDFEQIFVFHIPKGKYANYGKAYKLALELRKKGFAYSVIKDEIKKRLDFWVGTTTLHDWINGKSKPLSLKEIPILVRKTKKKTKNLTNKTRKA